MVSFIVLPKCSLPLLGSCPKVIKLPQPQASSLPVWAGFRGLGQGQMHACVQSRRVWEQPASWRDAPCQRDSLASTASWGHSLKLTVHSPVQSNCPGAPVGAVARPTRGPAWPSLTMWQAWMAAHSRASFQCCLPRSQMLPLEKNCFTI